MSIDTFMASLILVLLLLLGLAMYVNFSMLRHYLNSLETLTDKIKAPDLATYKQLTSPQAKSQQTTINHQQKAVPLSEADPEAVMDSIAKQLGREEE